MSKYSTLMVVLGLQLSNCHLSALELRSPSDYAKAETERTLSEIPQGDLKQNSDVERQARRTPGRNPRIVNGRGTADYPAAGALLKGPDSSSAKIWCSGTLVGCDKFLTAAHCIEDDLNTANYQVFFPNAGFFEVSRIDWQKDKYDFPNADIAVMTLKRQVERIVPEQINRSGKPLSGTEGVIVGFGRTGGSNYDFGIKREGYVKTATCPAGYSNTTLVCWNFDAEMEGKEVRSNTCNADSGGPMFANETVGGRQFTRVIGVTSGGIKKSCLIGDQGYDVNVDQYKSWLSEVGISQAQSSACGSGRPLDTDRHVLAGTEELSETNPEIKTVFPVAPDISRLLVSMNGDDNGFGKNDFDLHLIEGEQADLEKSRCSQTGSGQFAFCEIAGPKAGKWTLLVKRKKGAGLVQITLTRLPKD